MAINTITYANKSAIYTNASIPDANKVNDSDMNEIKTVVNDNATLMGDLATLNTTDKSSIVNAINQKLSAYNLVTGANPIKTGRQIGGNDEYVVRIDLGNLPNATTKNVQLGFSINRLIKIEGSAFRSGDNTHFSLPFVSSSAQSQIGIFMVNSSTVQIVTGVDRSNCTGWADIYYY